MFYGGYYGWLCEVCGIVSYFHIRFGRRREEGGSGGAGERGGR